MGTWLPIPTVEGAPVSVRKCLVGFNCDCQAAGSAWEGTVQGLEKQTVQAITAIS
jgi:hypothetical protein